MPQPRRPSLIPFAVVVGSASVLVVWNALLIARIAGLVASPPPTPRLVASTANALDPVAAEIDALMREAAKSPERMRQTELAIISSHACDVRGHLAAVLGEYPSLSGADAALSAACALRDRLARPLTETQRATAAAELRTNLASAAAQAAAAARPAPSNPDAANQARAGEARRLRDPLIGLTCGLACLFFARRPKPPPPPPDAAEPDWPTALEPESNRAATLSLLDDSGAFFFSEVFDRAPLPMVLLGTDGRIIRLNLHAEAMAAASTEQVRRQFYWDALVDVASRDSVREHWAASPPGVPSPATWRARDGSEHTWLWNRADFGEGSGPDRTGMVLLAGAPVPPPPQDTKLVEETARDLESELTLIAGHCELALDAPPSASARDGDLRHLQEAVDRAVHGVRRLLGGLAGTTADEFDPPNEPGAGASS